MPGVCPGGGGGGCLSFDLTGTLYLIMLPGKRLIRQLNYQKAEICLVNLLAAIFGDQRIEGFRATGK